MMGCAPGPAKVATLICSTGYLLVCVRPLIETIGNWKVGPVANGEPEPPERSRDRRAGPTGNRTYPQAEAKGDARISGPVASSEIRRIVRE